MCVKHGFYAVLMENKCKMAKKKTPKTKNIDF
jgi:hypothetical protein